MSVASGYRWRRLSPAQITEIARRLPPGSPFEVRQALADEYGVVLRTIDRARVYAQRERHRVELAGYVATFELENGEPIQVTPWVPA